MNQNHLSTSGEVWKPIPDYPGYEASTHGRIRSYWHNIYRGRYGQERILKPTVQRILKQCMAGGGYLVVALNRRQLKVSRLVLTAFIGPPGPGEQACHNDGNISDNRLPNLRWGSCKNNHADKLKHGTLQQGSRNGNAKLTVDIVKQIRTLYSTQVHTRNQIGEMFGISGENVGYIVHRRTWKHVP